MAHQSLYRRYRSQKFSEIVGQRHVTTGLRNAIAENRHGHAYLFSGPRGTGKTSTARILAKALNCPNVADGEPCGTCDSCQGIEQTTSFDLHELDAASHNKVDDVRDLISKVHLGSPGRTKVYILDEVHMLSSGAENALLKTLEEPPDHVVFVLATTEPHKVVPTIRSRTQHFEFHLIPADELEQHIRWIIDDAELDVGDDAIDYVLTQGGGSARDTLSALDLVVAAGGVPAGSDAGVELTRAIGQGDPAAAIAAVQDGLTAGLEPRTIGEATVDVLRNAFLASMQAPLHHLNDRSRDTAAELATALGPATVTRSLEAIGQALVEMRQAPDPRVPLEVAVLRLCRGGRPAPTGGDGSTTTGDDHALADKVADLERQLAVLTERLQAVESPGGSPPARSASGGEGDASGSSLDHRANPDTRSTPTADTRPDTRTAPEPGAAPNGGSAPHAGPAADAPSTPDGGAATPSGVAPSAPAPGGPANAARERLAGVTGTPLTSRPPAPADRPSNGAPVPADGDPGPSATATARPPKSPRRNAGPATDSGNAAPPAGVDRGGPNPGDDRAETETSPGSGATTDTSGSGEPDDDAMTTAATAATDGASDGGRPALSAALTLAAVESSYAGALDQVSQKTRVRFRSGRILGVEGTTVIVGFPNDIHRNRCLDVKGEVEQALSDHFGQAVAIDVVVDGDAPTPTMDPARIEARPAPAADADDDIGPVDELVDANDQSANGIERLAKAFPGSKMVDPPADPDAGR